MYEVYRKYKKNGFQNTLKMTKMCSLRGTVGGGELAGVGVCLKRTISAFFTVFPIGDLPLCSQYSGSVVPLAMFFATLMMEIDKFDSHA